MFNSPSEDRPSPVDSQSETSTQRRRLAAGLAAALLLSGAAALINQVVWQRSLNRLLGGSETVCSMTVVLVFMAGLGIGSLWMGGHCARLRDPLRGFGIVELLLFAVNLLVAWLLQLDVSQSVFAVQQVAAASGVPLLALYFLGSVLVLSVPCLLMGASMPLAAETCQRRFGLQDSRVLGLLFFVNTLGSVAGSLLGSGLLLPQFGQYASLLLALALNAVAGLVLIGLAWFYPGPGQAAATATSTDPSAAPRSILRPNTHEILAFGLGFCSLGYEMYLFRLLALYHQPLPYTFSAVVTGFLLYWSIGAALSARPRMSIGTGLRCCAAATLLSLCGGLLDSFQPITGLGSLTWFVTTKFVYFLPCLLFGYLFARVAAQAAKSWGQDVGRVYGWNTCGSCLGILLVTMIGYEMPYFLLVAVLAGLLLTLDAFQSSQADLETDAPKTRPRWLLPLAACGVLTAIGCLANFTAVTHPLRYFNGRDGVISVDPAGHMCWDGLWHSRLSDGENHIGTYNWYLGVCPVLVHPRDDVQDVCVIGLGLGISATTLAKLDTVEQVDAYEFNHTLKDVYATYPQGTLGLIENPKVHIIWQDARSGMSLNPKKYDIIQTQPVYLKQAGSSLLNSVEFYRLVASRLKSGGVFCLYSNGTPQQAFSVRQTAAEVFRHGETFMNGYLLVLSNDPLQLDPERLAARLQRDDPLCREIRSFELTASAHAVLDLLDQPRLPWGDGQLVITDDHPIVEYPAALERRVRRNYGNLQLAEPGIEHKLPRQQVSQGVRQ